MKSGRYMSVLCSVIVFVAIVYCRSDDTIENVRGSRRVKQAINDYKFGQDWSRKPQHFNFSKYISSEKSFDKYDNFKCIREFMEEDFSSYSC